MIFKLALAFLSFAVFLFGMWCLSAAVLSVGAFSSKLQGEQLQVGFGNFAMYFQWPTVVFAILGILLLGLSIPKKET